MLEAFFDHWNLIAVEEEFVRAAPGGLGATKAAANYANSLFATQKAKEHHFAIPAINVTSSSAINSVLEAARDSKSPVIIQISQGGAQFFGGKGLSNDGQAASILGAVAGAHHVRTVAKSYGVPVVLHSDHCAKKLEPWLVDAIEISSFFLSFKIHDI